MKQKILKFLDNFEIYIMFVLMLCFLVNVFLQVASRTIFHKPLGFTEEVSRYSFLWMVMLGFSWATKQGTHIRVSFLADRLPMKAQLVIKIIVNIIAVCLFAWVFYMGVQYVPYTAPTKTAALQISRAYIAIIVPITAVLMIIRSIQQVVINANKMKQEGEVK